MPTFKSDSNRGDFPISITTLYIDPKNVSGFHIDAEPAYRFVDPGLNIFRFEWIKSKHFWTIEHFK